jgi:hypothetical protein
MLPLFHLPMGDMVCSFDDGLQTLQCVFPHIVRYFIAVIMYLAPIRFLVG